ncbi:ABC transporter substrate-binding protein [Psittacicella hinzii]|uniref:ABC transporter substrate-binding protein n=1 Tax=Psittacicella hinzii TaxID=2028575 RepID=A0A3A1Y543_9GAMM|nr:nucleoside hydrolase [Psittacicella hinzii]RIY31144.1 ABC transporter substrate-binding protein [Psittacicella hinzii]
MVRKVYFNHDGGVDDLISLFLLLKMDQVELVGVGVVDADCYIEPAVSASRKIINRWGSARDKAELQVAWSDSRPVHQFPKEWRLQAFTMDALTLLNEIKPVVVQEAPRKAHLELVEILRNAEEPIDLLFTGPLTDLARALDVDASIESKIKQLYWMGGTFLERGNVEEPEHDGTAEWNAYWDPYAVKRVWQSSIKIHLVALESTNLVPLTPEVRDAWAAQRRYEGVDFLGNSYACVPPLTHFVTNSTYFLWDVLTTCYLSKPELAQSRLVYSDVITDGPSAGRTVLSEQGRPVNLVHHVDRDAFFAYVTDLAKK